MRDLVRSGKPVESSDIANSDSMRRLVEQRVALRSQLAEQSSTLLDQHPRIKELKAQIGEVDRQIRSEGERLARQLDNDAKVAGNRLESLTASLDPVKKLASQSNEQDVQLRALEREAKTQRDLLESYLAKYREASARDNINAAPPEARIISRATPPSNRTIRKNADGADRRLRRFRAVGGLHRDRCAAGAGRGALWIRLCAGAPMPRRSIARPRWCRR